MPFSPIDCAASAPTASPASTEASRCRRSIVSQMPCRSASDSARAATCRSDKCTATRSCSAALDCSLGSSSATSSEARVGATGCMDA